MTAMSRERLAEAIKNAPTKCPMAEYNACPGWDACTNGGHEPDFDRMADAVLALTEAKRLEKELATERSWRKHCETMVTVTAMNNARLRKEVQEMRRGLATLRDLWRVSHGLPALLE